MRKMRWMLSWKGFKRTWYLEFRNCIVSPFNHPCRYRNEPALGRDLDPLGWWRGRREQYPNLVRLARKFLCVPATSTQAERVFSWMGFLLNKRRLSLSGESVSMQLFLKDNLEWTDFLFDCLRKKITTHYATHQDRIQNRTIFLCWISWFYLWFLVYWRKLHILQIYGESKLIGD